MHEKIFIMTGLHALPARVSRISLLRQTSKPSRFSTSSRHSSYADTLPNLKIGAHTRVLYQGFTGKQATVNAEESLAYGTKIVGGVKPNVEGEHLGLPVFPSVRAAQEKSKPDASAIYVPGHLTAKAIEEAIEAEIPLVVAVAEHVPIHDLLRVHSMLQTQSKTRLVGANCPGIISAIGKCRIGFQPLPCFTPGNVGIVAKSGTLSYETVASTTRAGLGQSLSISMGGDVMAGTNFVDALNVFENDPDTEGVMMVGEIGGTAEMDAAEWIRDYHRRCANPKPIMGLIGGFEAPPGRIMGHAGAWAGPGEPDAKEKYQALERVGVTMVNHPEKFGEGMKTLLGNRQRTSKLNTPNNQTRGFHTMRRTTLGTRPKLQQSQQTRSLFIKPVQALDMLKKLEIPIRHTTTASESDITVSLTVDRNTFSPSIIVSPTSNFDPVHTKSFPFSYNNTADFTSSENSLPKSVASYLQLPERVIPDFAALTQALWHIFQQNEAFLLQVRAHVSADGSLEVHDALFGFDDAALRGAAREGTVHELRNPADEVPEELEAEKSGIVYVKLPGKGSIGTLVNGAGLAMNTVDAVTINGGNCANFLDTGGKATSKTVEASFKILTSDPRVEVIFVNIFGGLTRCDMIAEGIIDAFQNLKLKIPAVVRLRGTNEEAGQKMIAESGLRLHAFDSFEDAAAKAVSLAS